MKSVWATRSPYRPNSLGLSCVKIEAVEAPYVVVSGADMMSGTPIYDIKPYLPESESKPDALSGFAERRPKGGTVEDTNAINARDPNMEVVFSEELLELIPQEKRAGLIRVLSLDPRGAYEKKSGYTYGLSFGDHDIKFYVEGDCVFVTGVEEKLKR